MNYQQAKTVYDLYYAALEADNALRDELIRVYGEFAGDARYQYRHLNPDLSANESIMAALERKRIADAEYMLACAA